MAANGAEEDLDDLGHNLFMVRHARVWSTASTIQLVPGSDAAVMFNLKAIALLREKDFTR